MPVSISQLVSGTTITPQSINDVFQQVQDFLNGGIEKSDIVSTGSTLISPREITKPEFYGAPAPRVELVSGDVHYRSREPLTETLVIHNEMTTRFVPIPGLSASIFVNPESTNEKCQAILTATFSAVEGFLNIKSSELQKRNNGSGTPSQLDHGVHEEEESICAEFAAFVNGTQIPGTLRYLHSSFGVDRVTYNNQFDFTYKQVSISCIVTLNKGSNNVSIRVKPRPDLDVTFRDGTSSNFGQTTGLYLMGHIYVSSPSMYCETLIK
tara:strand:- start:874 stop:1674 length:801 start_codon:yes stop_codon:yes gene_type:complete